MKKRMTKLIKKTFSIYSKILAVISTIFSIVVIFLPWDRYDDIIVYFIGIAFLILLILAYLFCVLIYWFYTKRLRKIKIKINGSEIIICSGDIFSFDKNYLKIIAFNSRFDTHVGDGIIDSLSLNGIYLNKFYKTSEEIDYLNKKIIKDNHLNKLLTKVGGENSEHKEYKLGSIYKNNDFLLLAFTRFDVNNNARFTTLNELSDCFLRMWTEIDELKGSCSIAIPLLGSGRTTRIGKKGAELNVSNQELLELILSTFKISRIKIRKPANIIIVLSPDIFLSDDLETKIDLTRIKEIY